MTSVPAGVVAKVPLDQAPKLPREGALGVTFRDSKSQPIHGWYPYVEGFSATYIQDLVRSAGREGLVYDPFGGSGTVNLIAARSGIESAFSEANPFMRFVAETKANVREHAQREWPEFSRSLERVRRWISSDEFKRSASRIDLNDYAEAFNGRDFFDEEDLRQLLAIRDAIEFFAQGHSPSRELLRLALGSITVSCSHMTRRADLRRRRSDEYLGRTVDVRGAYLAKVAQIERDTQQASVSFAPAKFVSPDARHLDEEMRGKVSLVLTSPPYLNGTNYMRNTKLELWLLGFIASEKELSQLNKVCMVCGINNVVKGRPPKHRFKPVEEVARRLDETSPDLRIPALVRGYFSDMLQVLANCATYLRPGGRVVLDIGDSKFYGVHVPTDKLLCDVAREAGLSVVGERLLARRHSRDKTPLTQVELSFAHVS
jgi:hypothetical protein